MASDIRVLGPSGIEDYHAHLLRLDRASCFPGIDDHAIDTHCLDLMASSAILVGAYVDGVMRAGIELVPDRTARRAEAAITVETGFYNCGLERELIARLMLEARRYHLQDVRVHDHRESKIYRVEPAKVLAYAANG